MVKYTKAFKVQVAEHYLTGREGYQGMAKEFGIACELIREWSRLYERWGENLQSLYNPLGDMRRLERDTYSARTSWRIRVISTSVVSHGTAPFASGMQSDTVPSC